MHPGQLELTADVVRGLVDRQFPTWRDLPVRGLRTSGTVNALFRIGDGLVAILVAAGRLAGVIDVDGLGPADPALDLVGAWHLFDAGPRRALRADLGSGDLEWARGAAWALEQALGLGWYYADTNPAMSELGLTTLGRLLADPPEVPAG